MLTGAPRTAVTDEVRGDGNPLKVLRKCQERLGITIESPGQPLEDPVKEFPNLQNDRYGCFAGGIVALEFSDYCCVGIPTTVYSQQATTYFFEWFLDPQYDGLFKAKTRDRPEWPKLIAVAVEALRKRLRVKSRAGTIRIDISDLLELYKLKSFGPEVLAKTIKVHSRFGERHVVIEALFVDRIYRDAEMTPHDCMAEISEWAEQCLDDVLSAVRVGRPSVSIGTLDEARSLAQSYWYAHLSEDCFDRYEASELVSKTDRSEADDLRLDALCERIGVRPKQVREMPEKVSLPRSAKTIGLWDDAVTDKLAARWVALFIAVRAEEFYRVLPESHKGAGVGLESIEIPEARLVERLGGGLEKLQVKYGLRRFSSTTGETYFEWPLKQNKELDDILFSLGPLPEALITMAGVRRDILEGKLGKEKVTELIRTRRLAMCSDVKGREYIDWPITRSANEDDIYVALDPLPTSFLTYRNIKNRSRDTTKITNPAKELGERVDKSGHVPNTGWGSLGLSIKDVLNGRSFDCDWCETVFLQKGDRVDAHPTEGKYHGIRPGEGKMLRAYADEIGFPQEEWPRWLWNAP